MTFLDEAVELSYKKKPVQCRMCRVLDDLDPEMRAQVQRALSDPEVTSAGISRALKKQGLGLVAGEGVRRHRVNHMDSNV